MGPKRFNTGLFIDQVKAVRYRDFACRYIVYKNFLILLFIAVTALLEYLTVL